MWRDNLAPFNLIMTDKVRENQDLRMEVDSKSHSVHGNSQVFHVKRGKCSLTEEKTIWIKLNRSLATLWLGRTHKQHKRGTKQRDTRFSLPLASLTKGQGRLPLSSGCAISEEECPGEYVLVILGCAETEPKDFWDTMIHGSHSLHL